MKWQLLLLRVFAGGLLAVCAKSSAGADIVQAFDGPLVITRGGVYTGNWSSDDPSVPAVLVQTTDPVTIENSTIRGRGDLIAGGVDHTNITVRNTRGIGLNPNVAGRTAGRFFTAEVFDNAVIENNELVNTAGIYFLTYGGDFAPNHTIKVRCNRAHNIDGRRSDGHGGYLDYNTRISKRTGTAENGFVEMQFVQLDKVRHLGGIAIAWNEVINDPGDSRVEDNISIFLSSGTAESMIRIHDNFIRGGWTIRPWQASTEDASYKYDWSYSGGGIMLGDGDAPLPADAPAFVEAFNNQIIATSNYGIAISAGHDLNFHDNRILSCGLLADGRPIAAQNVGAYIWDTQHGAARNPPTFLGDSGRDNLIGWVRSTERNDWWTPDAARWANNTHWPGEITLKTETGERKVWQDKLKAAGIRVGRIDDAAARPADK